ncbi:MAG: hypothetical protein ABIR33_06655 [Pyrinomonadaceae bacterium]
MKILFYFLALIAATLGLIALFRATETALGGGGVDIIQFVIGVIGILLASLWVMRARAAK